MPRNQDLEKRAKVRILLDQGKKTREICDLLHVSSQMVTSVRTRMEYEQEMEKIHKKDGPSLDEKINLLLDVSEDPLIKQFRESKLPLKLWLFQQEEQFLEPFRRKFHKLYELNNLIREPINDDRLLVDEDEIEIYKNEIIEFETKLLEKIKELLV